MSENAVEELNEERKRKLRQSEDYKNTKKVFDKLFHEVPIYLISHPPPTY